MGFEMEKYRYNLTKKKKKNPEITEAPTLKDNFDTTQNRISIPLNKNICIS